jgi:hypothetical protein
MQVVEPDQPGRSRLLQRAHPGRLPRQTGRGGQDLHQLARIIDRGDQNRIPGQGGQPIDPGGEGALQPGRQRQRLQQRPGHRAQHGWKLYQGERVTLRLAQDPLLAGVAQVTTVLGQDGPCRCVVQPLKVQLGQPGGGEGDVVARAHAADHDDRVGVHPAGDEREYVLAGLVQPLHVVRNHQHRAFGRHPGQQVQRGQGDHVRFGLLPVFGPEGRGQRTALRHGQSGRGAEYRPQQQVQAGERQLRLGFDARRQQNLQESRPARMSCGTQQRGLADARLAEDHDGGTASLGA